MGFRRQRADAGRAIWLKAASLIIAAAGMLPGCGYRFQGPITLPENAQRIYIETFQNRTNQELLEALVTNAIVFEFTKRSETLIAEEPSKADLIMKGVIRSLDSQTLSPRKKDSAGERRVTLRMDVQLVRADGRVVWEAKGLSENDAYPVTDDKFQNDQRERRAAVTVAVRIAERIFDRFTDDF
jgi:outer membrane lipopolysaccharide assembly protein LptE/RlpB